MTTMTIPKYTEIALPELGIAIEPSILTGAHTNEYRIVAAIRSTNTFHHSYIRTRKIHVYIALDTSGSMGGDMMTIQSETYMSRIICCITAINKLLEFFRVLAENGIDVYFTLVGFHTEPIPVFEHKKIPASMDEIRKMQEECELVHPLGATNVGAVLNHIAELRRRYDTADAGEYSSYSILLSDGYVTSGLDKAEIQRGRDGNPQWIFNTTIGIGESSDYDEGLLDSLSAESSGCRGCACADDLYDNLLSSIFQQMDIHANGIEWEGPVEYKYPLQKAELRYGQFIAASTGTMFARYEPSMEIKMKMRHENVRTGEQTGCIQRGIWSVSYDVEWDDDSDLYMVTIRLVANTMPAVRRQIRFQQIHGKMMQDYLKCIREFYTYDMQSKIMVDHLYLHFSKWLSDIDGMASSPVLERMKIILNEMWKRIDQLYQQFNETGELQDSDDLSEPSLSDFMIPNRYGIPRVNFASSTIFPLLQRAPSQIQRDATQTPAFMSPYRTPMLVRQGNALLTPSQTISSIQIMRSQTAQGNYAFIGRMMTESYSQSSI